MANLDTPMGFRPFGEVRQTLSYVAGERIFPGDCVTAQTDGKLDVAAAAGDVLGVALEYADADGDAILVSIHPGQMYVVQVDDNGYGAQADDFDTMDILATAGNTTYNQSRQELDGSSKGASQQFVIHSLYKEIGNAVGSQAEVICTINAHQIMGEDDSAGLQ